tara:strand:- start:176000 stop:176569 length:570 start_codon:yes stop_codon:yes gene_type:complete
MYLFKKSVMFDTSYKFGKVKVHPCVIDQLQNWVDRKAKKFQKFGGELINDIIAKVSLYTSDIKEPTYAQRERSIKILQIIEGNLDNSEMSMATDKVDQNLLVLAYVNQAYLATQEKTMKSIGSKSLPKGRVVRFEHLALDLIEQRKLTYQDIQTGMHSLNHYNEILDSTLKAKIWESARALCQEDSDQI